MRHINKEPAAIALLGSISVIPLLILPAMVGGIIDYYGLSDAAAGWSAALNFVGGAAASIAVSMRVRHLDLPRVTAFGFLLAAAADLLSAAVGAHSETLFMIVRLLAGIGAGGAYAAIMASIARKPEADKGYGFLMTLQFALSAMGLYAVPLVLPVIGVNGVFVAIAMIELVAIRAVGILATPALATAPAREAAVEIKVLLGRAALFSIVGIGLYEASNTAQFAYAERMGVAMSLAPATIGTALGIASILGIPGAFCIIWIGDRVNRGTMLLLGIGGSIAGLLLLLLASNVYAYTASLCMLGFCWAFTLPYFQTIQAGLDKQGSIVAAGACASTMGNAFGPGAAAAVVGTGDYVQVIWVAIGLSVMAALLMLSQRTQSSAAITESS